MKLVLIALAILAVAGCKKEGPPPAAPSEAVPNVDLSKLKDQRAFPLDKLEKTTVVINGHKIACWIMDNEAKCAEGLMWLQDGDVSADQGMLFVFPSAAPQSFWMRNTYIPLQIVYIGADKKVVNVAHGAPLDETGTSPSAGPAEYVLELKDPDADKYDIKPGTKVEFPDSIKAD